MLFRSVLSGLTERRRAEQELFLRPAASATGNMQAAFIEHVQLNYQTGNTYKVVVDGLRIRTKKAGQGPNVLPDGTVIGNIANGTRVRNQATARVGDAIWMYIGLDKRGREQWICADTGDKAYIK